MSKFLVSTLNDSAIDSLEIGQKLIKDGFETVLVYQKLISISLSLKQTKIAEMLNQAAVKKYPNQAADFRLELYEKS